jgi:S-DNA-T family DNA segregation ATPase FtsK/SpoIIIE
MAAALAAGVAKELLKRMPDGPEAAAARSGPRVVLLVDDYDLLSGGGQRPLEALLPLVPAARDIGLHVVLTRPVAGAARALYEPFVLAVRETGTTGLVLAGDRAEGPIFPGVYAGPQPPGRGWWVRRGEPGRLVQIATDRDTP